MTLNISKLLKRRLLPLLLTILYVGNIHAESNDFGLWLSAGMEKRIYKKWKADIDVDFRTRNDFKTVDRWSASANISYKVKKWLEMDAGYTLLYDNRLEKVTYNLDNEGNIYSYNNWRPGYWAARHRFNVSATGEVKVGNIGISLRERWQYTYRPEKTTERYDFDNMQWEDTNVSGKGSNLLRSRLQIEYSKKKNTLKPFANIELFNSMALEKVRLTAGTDIRINKQNIVKVFYRCQFTSDKDTDNEPNRHYIGAGYSYKF